MSKYKLQQLKKRVEKILKEELKSANIIYDLAEVSIYNCKSVGIKGDKRVYEYPAEIELRLGKNIVWDVEFAFRLSNRITNEVKGINRVLYFLASDKDVP